MRLALVSGTCLLLAASTAVAQTAPPTGGSGTGVIVPAPMDPVDRADAYLARTGAPVGSVFERRGVHRVASGTVVRYVQRHQGVLVRDGGIAVLVAPSGIVRATNDFAARALPPAPRPGLSATAAAAIARAHVGGQDPGDDAQRTFLVWTREFGAPRLVYECDLAPLLHRPDAPRVLIDAVSGRVVRRTNRVRNQSAHVYRANPVSTPDLDRVELLGVTGDGVLEGADIDSYNCIDDHRVYRLGGTRIHLCSPVHTAHPGADGVFSFDTSTPNAVDDPYAELSMYHHASQHLAFMRGLGLEQLRTRPLRTVANVRFPFEGTAAEQADPNGPLQPFDNAAFIPGSPPNALAEVYGAGRDALVFGQGASVDFAYDGDVVAHEIGHAVVASTADFGDELLDEWGADIAPRALDEALADYFSSARAGDPRVGEYAGSGDWSAGEIRNLAVTAPYPTALRGEAHIDSVPFSSTLWAIRERLGSEFDRAVYEALTMASVDVTNDSLAEQVVAATRRVLGESAGTTAAELFATRGVLPRAARVLPYPAQAGRVFMLPDVSMADLPYVPGYVQFRISAGAGADRLTFDLPVYTRQPPRLRVFVRANEPVRFRYPAPGVIEAEALAEIAPDTRTTRVQGVVRFEPLASAGSLYVAIGVEDSGQAWAGPIRLSVPGGANPPGDAGVSTDAGADAGAEPPTEFNGCGCRTMPQGRTGAGVALVALGLLAMRRMRRGGRSRAH